MKKGGILIAVTLIMMANVASAATSAATSAAPTSSSSQAEAPNSFLQNLSVTALSSVYGPGIGVAGDVGKTGVYFENQVAMGYKLNNGYGTGVAFNFDFNTLADNGFILQNPYIHIKKADLIKTSNYAMTAQIRAYAGVSTDSQNRNQLGALRFQTVHDYTIPNSRLSFNGAVYYQPYVYGSNHAADEKFGKAYSGIGANWQFTAALSAGLLWEGVAYNHYGNSLLDFSAGKGSTQLSPNLSWDVTPNLNVNPSIGMMTGETLNWDTTTLNVALTMKVL